MTGSTTILRGFKVSTAVLDAFLSVNHVYETYGNPPFYQHHPDKDKISALLYAKIVAAGGTADKNKFRVMIPSREGYSHSMTAYVTYAWATVFAQLELQLDEHLPVEVPRGFDELRQEMLSFCDSVPEINRIADEGKMGLYLVYTYEIRGLYTPQEIDARDNSPQKCDRCDAVFEDGPSPQYAFYRRQVHRKEAHRSNEGTSPLPNA